MKNVKITRRSFLLGLGAASSALLLSACGSTDAPASSASTISSRTLAPSACTSRSDMPSTRRLASTVTGCSGCCRENASRRWVSRAARVAPSMAMST